MDLDEEETSTTSLVKYQRNNLKTDPQTGALVEVPQVLKRDKAFLFRF